MRFHGLPPFNLHHSCSAERDQKIVEFSSRSSYQVHCTCTCCPQHDASLYAQASAIVMGLCLLQRKTTLHFLANEKDKGEQEASEESEPATETLPSSQRSHDQGLIRVSLQD